MDKWFNNNTIAKIIALCISIILWAMVHLDSTTSLPSPSQVKSKTINDVTVEVVGFDDKSYVLTSMEPKTVKLEVRGKRTDITSFFPDYKVILNLENIGPGTTNVPLTYELPAGVEMVSIEPSTARVTIEEKQTKSFTASLQLKGAPEGGLQVGTPILEHDGLVTVTLPESEMKRVYKVEGVLDISGIDDSVEGKSVKLRAYDRNGREIPGAEISPSSIKVDVPMNKLYKTVPLAIKQIGQLPSGYALSEIKADVEGVAVYGTKESLQSINSYTINVDLSQFKGPNTTEYSLDLTPPKGSEKIEPSSVKVVVKAAPLGVKVVNDIPVTIKNQSGQHTAKIITPANSKMSLTLQGAEQVLKAVKTGDITITADVSGLGPGVHTVTPDIVLPKFVTLAAGGGNLQVEIEIKDNANSVNTTPTGTEDSGDTGQETKSNSPDTGTGSGQDSSDGTDNPGSGKEP
ncbi:CdaR family protein [Paenibacillus tuaregi]|uniref:CdaR family protein n=1 Tax=Paenibacillus tuaregi TaxID=1816681 RepID=UPI000839601A|nr:CdaR family protein [Paenibacillus tuaregi]